MEREFDVAVVGAGPAGEVCAGRIGEKSKGSVSVALIENHLVGGECSYYGCMPSKALLMPGELLSEAKSMPGVKEAVTGRLDAGAVLARRDEIIHGLDDSAQLPWLSERAVELIRGHARLVGERALQVGDDVIRARRAVVIATGTGAAMPPIPGMEEVGAWDNRAITTASEVPASLAILGGGPVGAEMAQAWTALGTRVTLIEAGPRILAREEEFAGGEVTDRLREQGATVITGTRATSVAREAGRTLVALDTGGNISADRLLVAVGRKPATSDIGLESVGLSPGGFVEVDSSLRVPDVPWLFAIGDVNGRALLTHMGKYQGRLAADNILGGSETVRSEGSGPPRVTFTEPQVAAVGHTLESARASGLVVRAVDHPTGGVAGGSWIGRGASGTSRLVIDERRRVIVGATFTGSLVADSLHAATIAVVAEVPLERLWHAIPAFPTRSEVWLRLLETYGL